MSEKDQIKVRYHAFKPKKLAANDLCLRFIAAVINPADINMIEQTYLINPPIPFCLGNEGVFEVVALGSKKSLFSIGDRVIIPFKTESNWQGGWCSHCVVSSNLCVKVPSYISNKLAAMLTVNPLTAWLLLENIDIKKNNQPIIQNAANSNLGRFIAFFAKQKNIVCINIVRSSTAKKCLAKDQQTHCFIYEKGIEKHILNTYGFCQLALNGVGGDQAKSLAKTLKAHGTLITYGAMAREPLSFGNALLIYQNIRLTGFNRSRYIQENTKQKVVNQYLALFKGLKDCDESQFLISASYTLANINKALQAEKKEKKQGKILLTYPN